MGPNNEVTVYRYGKQPVYMDLGVVLASLDAPFEVRLTRPDYTQPVQVTQVLHGDGGTTQVVDLDDDLFTSWFGFSEFLEVTVADEQGTPLGDPASTTFCPSGWDMQRISDDGPVRPTYPGTCFGNPFTKGMVWGIDKNWGANLFSYEAAQFFLAPGHYTVSTRVADKYADAFGISEENRTFESAIEVIKLKDNCHHGCKGAPEQRGGHGAPYRAIPIDDSPDPSILPDLRALPAWGMSVRNKKNGKSFLSFGANVWVAGDSDLVVEGFRRSDEAIMDAFQYFFVDGEPVSKSQVGTLEYDPREGHTHWHFQQFAGYSLLDANMTEPGIKSKKEAFCLAATDAIDLTLPNADLTPDQIGIGTQCGGPSASWIREVLPLGWGDTYFQGRPGQSFNITGLPNGTYYVKVEANPSGHLLEQDVTNNIEYREVILSGKPGHRKVEVPPWNGIDTETYFGY